MLRSRPAAATGDEGWYTGDVSLAWKLADTGAALDLDGCEDETFAYGVHARTCEASDVVGSAGPVEVTVTGRNRAGREVTGGEASAVYVLASLAGACARPDVGLQDRTTHSVSYALNW